MPGGGGSTTRTFPHQALGEKRLAYYYTKSVVRIEDLKQSLIILQHKEHLKERLLDQAQARASYTPLFWGRSRSIPQCMV